MRRKAITRHDVEANAGQKRYPSRLGFGIPRGQGLEDLNFPGDVEVVNTIAETRVRYRPRRRGERTGDAEQHRNVLDRRINMGRVAQIKRPCRETKRLRERFDFA
jgi:hypothetical protein